MYFASNPTSQMPAPTMTFQRMRPITKLPIVKMFSTGPTSRCKIYGKSDGREAGIKPSMM